MADKKHLALLATMSPSSAGLYFAAIGLLGGLIHQGAVNREKLIDYLLQLRADLSPEERTDPYGLWIQVLIDHLDELQKQALAGKPH